jgi:hypothetical protein
MLYAEESQTCGRGGRLKLIHLCIAWAPLPISELPTTDSLSVLLDLWRRSFTNILYI